jgi:hypothetical protein
MLKKENVNRFTDYTICSRTACSKRTVTAGSTKYRNTATLFAAEQHAADDSYCRKHKMQKHICRLSKAVFSDGGMRTVALVAREGI